MADGFASPGNGITDDGYYTVADCVDPSVDREVAALLPCVDHDGILCEAGYLIDEVQLAKPVVPRFMLADLVQRCAMLPVRSEEHTSELQSLIRTPYAVFCFQQKKIYL